MSKILIPISLLVVMNVLIALPCFSQDTNSLRLTFDHSDTGFELNGSHEYAVCESCHVGGKFRGTPRECVACHSLNGFVNAEPKPGFHILSTESCENCHRETLWNDIDRVEHSDVFGRCDTCHNGRIADGKSIGHLPTTAQCDNCHSDVSWVPAGFDHTGITDGCSACHNGIEATGKDINHIPTIGECNECHSTIAWIPAFFDHLNITTGCIACHDGNRAEGKNVGHILSGNSCEDCHSTVAWVPALVNHDAVIGTCDSCHNGAIATGKPATHIPTVGQCDECHSTVSWTPANFSHNGITSGCGACHNGTLATGKVAGHFLTVRDCSFCHTPNTWIPAFYSHISPAYPGDHSGNLACTACHSTNADIINWPSTAFVPDCAACHALDYRSGPHTKVDSPSIKYSVSELRDCSGACHEYTDDTFSTILRMRSGEHSVSDGEF